LRFRASFGEIRGISGEIYGIFNENFVFPLSSFTPQSARFAPPKRPFRQIPGFLAWGKGGYWGMFSAMTAWILLWHKDVVNMLLRRFAAKGNVDVKQIPTSRDGIRRWNVGMGSSPLLSKSLPYAVIAKVLCNDNEAKPVAISPRRRL